jgi:hypothetical protein
MEHVYGHRLQHHAIDLPQGFDVHRVVRSSHELPTPGGHAHRHVQALMLGGLQPAGGGPGPPH